MAIIHDQANQQFLFKTSNGLSVGTLRYRFLSEHKIDAFSTRVDDAFQGQGIAGQLYNALMDFAEQRQLKIKPSCHYIEIKMARTHSHLMA